MTLPGFITSFVPPLRDLIAVEAMKAIADNIQTADTIARRSYEIADAMLRERARVTSLPEQP